MARPKKSADVELENVGAGEPKEFSPSDLTLEQQEAVVEEYLGVHPKYFIYEGLAIRLNHGRFEAEQRNIAKETGHDRKWFNGWKPKPSKYGR